MEKLLELSQRWVWFLEEKTLKDQLARAGVLSPPTSCPGPSLHPRPEHLSQAAWPTGSLSAVHLLRRGRPVGTCRVTRSQPSREPLSLPPQGTVPWEAGPARALPLLHPSFDGQKLAELEGAPSIWRPLVLVTGAQEGTACLLLGIFGMPGTVMLEDGSSEASQQQHLLLGFSFYLFLNSSLN